jgi:hypothetical protein
VRRLVEKETYMFGRLLLTAILAMGFALAQDEMGGGGGGRSGASGGRGGGGGDMGGPGPMMPRRTNKVEQIADKLKLNKEQKEDFAKILSAARERAMSVRTEMDKARADLAGAMIDGSPEKVSNFTAAYATVAAKMTAIEADAFGKIYAELKPNQQGKAEQAFELMAGVFSAPAAGGGMNRGMGAGMGSGGGSGRGRGGR